MNLPEVVSAEEWQAAREQLLAKEKRHMREGDALAAERRRQPMVRIEKDYVFEGSEGEARLIDFFAGRRQLALYHFMFGPNQDVGCDGCCLVVDQIVHPAHLHARDVTFALVSRAPLVKLEPFKRRMGWDDIPWYSSFETDFSHDFGLGPETPAEGEYQDGEMFGLSVFIRDDDHNVYRTYFTSNRGVEAVGTLWSFLDRTPLGRQEEWEDTPEGRPQGPPYAWWRRHDEYETQPVA